MTEKREKRIESDAQRAIRYNTMFNASVKVRNGGNKLTHKPSSYGVALKWLIYIKNMTYKDFAKKYDGSTAQNINYYINRVPKEYFTDVEIENMCKALCIEYDYFISLTDEIERILKV